MKNHHYSAGFWKGNHTMCEANAYLVNDGQEVLVMEAVDTVEPEEDGLRLQNIFGEQKFLNAEIFSLSLVGGHKILLKEKNA